MSYYGVKFNGKHSNDFGAYMKSVDRMLLPALRKRELVIPDKSGTYEFEGDTYENKVITVRFTLLETSLNALRLKARQMAAWLSTSAKKQLIFDDEPDKYYMAKVYGSISPEEIVDTGSISVEFECEPFAYAINETTTAQSISSNNTDIYVQSDGTIDTPTIIEMKNNGSNTITELTLTNEYLSN